MSPSSAQLVFVCFVHFVPRSKVNNEIAWSFFCLSCPARLDTKTAQGLLYLAQSQYVTNMGQSSPPLFLPFTLVVSNQFFANNLVNPPFEGNQPYGKSPYFGRKVIENGAANRL